MYASVYVILHICVVYACVHVLVFAYCSLVCMYTMIDLLELRIPIDASHCTSLDDGYSKFAGDVYQLGVNLAGKGLYRTDDGIVKADIEYHAYESLPTSFTGIAMKMFLESRDSLPYVQIKCSPAKIMQGHNVFGSMDLELCADEMIQFLALAYPELSSMLYTQGATVSQMDITFSARLPNESTAEKVIHFLKNVSSKQRRSRFTGHSTTAGWGGATSRLIKLKAYLKQYEFQEQLEEHIKAAQRNNIAAQRIVEVMSDPRLIEWTKCLLRWEATIKHRWLERKGISVNLWDLIKLQKEAQLQDRCILSDWWEEATRDIFQALEDQTMRFNDDRDVLDRLILMYQTVTKKGNFSNARANHLYGFYQDLKREEISYLKQRYGKHYYGKFNDLMAIGFSKAQLQNLKAQQDDPTNVIPIMRFVKVDFNAQRPDWYQEPVSYFAQMKAA